MPGQTVWNKLPVLLLAAVMLTALLPNVPVSAANYTVTPSTGTIYDMTNGNNYVINGNYSVTNYTIRLTSGSATLTINGNVTLDDRGVANRSPMALTNNATLTLIVNRGYTLTLYGGPADGSTVVNGAVQEKFGGRAGLQVPVGSRVNIVGGGTVKAYGGNGNFGGAGAGIGGYGGSGYIPAKLDTVTGINGGAGLGAGTVSIFSTRVEAYGGAAGQGQTVRGQNRTKEPTAGSGYPAAGIGGGGAGGGSWGGHISGASLPGGGGGFNGGAPSGQVSVATDDGIVAGNPGSNGSAGVKTSGRVYSAAAPGGGYFEKAVDVSNTNSNRTSTGGGLGGGRVTVPSASSTNYSGAGGQGGAGGTVYADSGSTVVAYNGSYAANTTATAANQTPIYAQLGYTVANIAKSITSIPASYRTASTLPNYLSSRFNKTLGTTAYPGLLGVGSGAGYTEGGNGSYTAQSSKPGKPTVTASDSALSVYGWTKPAYNIMSLTGYSVNVYSDAACKTLVKTVGVGTTISTASAPCMITGLSNGTTYYVTVTALFSGYGGEPSDVVDGTPYRVTISPAAGAYFLQTTVKLADEGFSKNGYTLVYSTDGSNWLDYPNDGVTVTASATVQYGGRRSDGSVLKLGSSAYTIFDVTASPESGRYRKSVTATLSTNPANVSITGYQLAYSTDGVQWHNYPAGGVSFTESTEFYYGVLQGNSAQQSGMMKYDVFDVTASPESGMYYKEVTVTLSGKNVQEMGGKLVYSMDGESWQPYPSGGLLFTQTATLHYGVDMGAGEIYSMGTQSYTISDRVLTFASLTLHAGTAGEGNPLTTADLSGISGAVCAKLTGIHRFSEKGGYLVLAAYNQQGMMEQMTLTALEGDGGEVVSRPITVSKPHAIQAFVVMDFVDVAPIGKVTCIGEHGSLNE